MFPEPPRRRKRRGRIIILIVVALLLSVSFAFANLRSDRAGLREFVDVAEVSALAQRALAVEFGDFLSFEIQGADRDTINALFGSIATATTAAITDLAAVEVPPVGARAEAMLEAALESWQSGSALLAENLLLAADEPANPIPVIGIDDALSELRVGDRLYERFLEAIADLRIEVETELGEVPFVAYLPTNGIRLSGEMLAAAVRDGGGVAATHDVRIGGIELDPGFTGGDRDGVGVLAFTDVIGIDVVVSNVGNLVETDLAVAVRVTTTASQETLFSEQTVILSLDPGASRTVGFVDVPVREGMTHEVVAIVSPVAGDVDLDNNTATLPFFIQASS